jgi:hypothetical protein
MCVSVCGSTPLLGCRPIRVRVESLYMYSISYQYSEFTLLHGIRGSGLGFPSTAAAGGSPPPSRRLPSLPPGGPTFPPGGGLLPPNLLLPPSSQPHPHPVRLQSPGGGHGERPRRGRAFPCAGRPCTVFPTRPTPAAHGTGPWRTVRAWRPSHVARRGCAPPLGGSSAARLPDAGAGRPRASLLASPGGPARRRGRGRPRPPAPAAWAWPPTLRGARTPPPSSSVAAAASSPRSGPGMAMAASCFGPPQRRRRRDRGWTPCAPSPAKGGPAAATSTCTLPPPIGGALLAPARSRQGPRPTRPGLGRARTPPRTRPRQDATPFLQPGVVAAPPLMLARPSPFGQPLPFPGCTHAASLAVGAALPFPGLPSCRHRIRAPLCLRRQIREPAGARAGVLSLVSITSTSSTK